MHLPDTERQVPVKLQLPFGAPITSAKDVKGKEEKRQFQLIKMGKNTLEVKEKQTKHNFTRSDRKKNIRRHIS